MEKAIPERQNSRCKQRGLGKEQPQEVRFKSCSTERQIRKLNEEIAAVEATIEKQWEENGMPRGAVKNLEKIKKGKQAQLKKLMDASGKDDVLKFEDLGVDYLFVDEAHAYKNLFLFTKMNNVAGISNAASQRASDLKLKCEYLQELHGSDRGVVFATGTPISNSMTEMYTMQTYLQPSTLKDLGITFFDGWAADFGETVTSMELSPSGQGYRARTRFAKFTNLPELLKLQSANALCKIYEPSGTFETLPCVRGRSNCGHGQTECSRSGTARRQSETVGYDDRTCGRNRRACGQNLRRWGG